MVNMTPFEGFLHSTNAYIRFLEEKLRRCIEDGNHSRRELYAKEAVYRDEVCYRQTIQRHLEFEQHESGLLQEKYIEAMNDLNAILTYNELLRQQARHQQAVIGSMTGRLSSYESQVNPLPAKTSGGVWSGPRQASTSSLPVCEAVASAGEADSAEITPSGPGTSLKPCEQTVPILSPKRLARVKAGVTKRKLIVD